MSNKYLIPREYENIGTEQRVIKPNDPDVAASPVDMWYKCFLKDGQMVFDRGPRSINITLDQKQNDLDSIGGEFYHEKE